MNDFTKEELEEIYDSIMCYTEPTNDDLLTKIQTMINNYCEHDWDNSCCGCSMQSIYCTKCNKDLEK